MTAPIGNEQDRVITISLTMPRWWAELLTKRSENQKRSDLIRRLIRDWIETTKDLP